MERFGQFFKAVVHWAETHHSIHAVILMEDWCQKQQALGHWDTLSNSTLNEESFMALFDAMAERFPLLFEEMAQEERSQLRLPIARAVAKIYFEQLVTLGQAEGLLLDNELAHVPLSLAEAMSALQK